MNGVATIFTGSGLDLTLDAFGDSALVVADIGNAAIKASNSTAKISAWGNSNPSSSLWMFSGSGDTTFAAGAGMSVFSGGNECSNSFMFIKPSVAGGQTIILNFDQNPNNSISLLQYGLDQNSLKEILNKAYNANGNAVIELENHTIILAGILADKININQFAIG